MATIVKLGSRVVLLQEGVTRQPQGHQHCGQPDRQLSPGSRPIPHQRQPDVGNQQPSHPDHLFGAKRGGVRLPVGVAAGHVRAVGVDGLDPMGQEPRSSRVGEDHHGACAQPSPVVGGGHHHVADADRRRHRPGGDHDRSPSQAYCRRNRGEGERHGDVHDEEPEQSEEEAAGRRSCRRRSIHFSARGAQFGGSRGLCPTRRGPPL